MFAVSITGVKLSLLSLYHRIFTTVWVRRSSIALSVLCVLWLIVIVVGSIFVCYFTLNPYRCIDFSLFFLVLSLAEVLIDIAILCLPLGMIPGLKLPLQHKIVLYVTFLVGGLQVTRPFVSIGKKSLTGLYSVCITGIARVALTYKPKWNCTFPHTPPMISTTQIL